MGHRFIHNLTWLSLTIHISSFHCHGFLQNPPQKSFVLDLSSTNAETSSMTKLVSNRRDWISANSLAALSIIMFPIPSLAIDQTSSSATTPWEVTDRIFLNIKSSTDIEPRRLVIGLYGREAPRSTNMLKQLVSSPGGLSAPCKPKDTSRIFEKEQLEANRVYNNCMESQNVGVTYDGATIWRIIANERIDVGAVSGKFIAREYPTWDEIQVPSNHQQSSTQSLEFGTVTVQRGKDSGFGFTIWTNNSTTTTTTDNVIVVGKVLEGLSAVQDWNQSPVVKSSQVSYMALTGSDGKKQAPSRACRYGSTNLYCNEYKPLQKLSIVASGIL
jgi:cyclophilin family peptidyl-prolyl cis-trans isomerase